jgi:hypothetical protein
MAETIVPPDLAPDELDWVIAGGESVPAHGRWRVELMLAANHDCCPGRATFGEYVSERKFGCHHGNEFWCHCRFE